MHSFIGANYQFKITLYINQFDSAAFELIPHLDNYPQPPRSILASIGISVEFACLVSVRQLPSLVSLGKSVDQPYARWSRWIGPDGVNRMCMNLS